MKEKILFTRSGRAISSASKAAGSSNHKQKKEGQGISLYPIAEDGRMGVANKGTLKREDREKRLLRLIEEV